MPAIDIERIKQNDSDNLPTQDEKRKRCKLP